VAFAPKENPKIAIAIYSRKWWIGATIAGPYCQFND
jgi:cell division protein FtsI/penicillin-binding protein 2